MGSFPPEVTVPWLIIRYGVIRRYRPDEEASGDDIISPLAELLAAQHGFAARSGGMSEGHSLDQEIAELIRHSAPTTRATPKGGSSAALLENTLSGI